MATRNEILGAIRTALGNDEASPKLPPPVEVWPVADRSFEERLESFSERLNAVSGRLVRCADDDALAEALVTELRKIVGEKPSRSLGTRKEIVSLVETVLSRLGGDSTILVAPTDPAETDPHPLEKIDAAIIPAEYLLADTGTCVIEAKNAFDRILCYLSPVSFIVAKKSTLREHLPHVWAELSPRMADPENITGEFLLMTGPSRTADIEKVLILGVHGPKTLVVFVLENR